MCVHRDEMVKSCQRSGFVGFGNSQVSLDPAILSDSPYYTPVRYPGTLNANAASAADCEESVKSFLIAFGVVIFFVELLQVETHAVHSPKLFWFWFRVTPRSTLHRWYPTMLLDYATAPVTTGCTINRSKTLKSPDTTCPQSTKPFLIYILHSHFPSTFPLFLFCKISAFS